MLAGRLDRHLVEVRDLALAVVIGILDVDKEGGDLAAQLGIEDALPRILPVGGGDRLAVRPFVVSVEGDRPRPPVGADLDALGLLKDELAGVVNPRQRLEELLD